VKPASDQLIALLGTSNFLWGDLYQFTLNNGAKDYFSALDVPVTWSGNTYRANGLRIEGLKYKLATGLQVDEQIVRVGAYPSDTLAGTPFLAGLPDGLLDGAYLLRSRAFWQRTTGIPSADYFFTPIGVIELVNMLVAEVTKIGRTHAEISVKSPTKLLDLNMPRNFFTPGCRHTLFDQGCTLVKASYGVSGSFSSGATQLTLPVTGGIAPSENGADGLPYYAQGRLLFTSGANDNIQVSIMNNDASHFYLNYPLDVAPLSGDTYTAFPGCSKMMNTCSAKFANLPNFGGFPYVPPVFISV